MSDPNQPLLQGGKKYEEASVPYAYLSHPQPSINTHYNSSYQSSHDPYSPYQAQPSPYDNDQYSANNNVSGYGYPSPQHTTTPQPSTLNNPYTTATTTTTATTAILQYQPNQGITQPKDVEEGDYAQAYFSTQPHQPIELNCRAPQLPHGIAPATTPTNPTSVESAQYPAIAAPTTTPGPEQPPPAKLSCLELIGIILLGVIFIFLKITLT